MSIEAVAQDVTKDPVELPAHVARCATCDAGVKYRLTPSGGGVFVLERYGMDVDTSIGLGESSAPLCPNGHGEMLNADEQLVPVAEALQQVADQVNGSPTQQRLPGVVIPFNYEGVFQQLVEKAREVQRLKVDAEDAARDAREAAKAWKDAATAYTTMALEFDRRRREKAGEPAADLVEASERPDMGCTFEQAHPGDTCPLCSAETVPDAARDSLAHREAAERVLLERECEDLSDRLSNIDVVLVPRAILALEAELRNELVAWLTDAEQHPDDRDRWIAALPRALDTCHVAAEAGEKIQACTACGATLLAMGDADVDNDPYPVGTLVGSECQGTPAEVTHHYPAKTGKKGRGKKAAPETPAQAETTSATGYDF